MSIGRFYAGRSLFITGGSGFIGKQVIEKLLRSCSDIDRIYVLMRAKKEQSPQQRLQKMLSSAVCLACMLILCILRLIVESLLMVSSHCEHLSCLACGVNWIRESRGQFSTYWRQNSFVLSAGWTHLRTSLDPVFKYDITIGNHVTNWKLGEDKTRLSSHRISRLDKTVSKFSVADSLVLSPIDSVHTTNTDKTRQDKTSSLCELAIRNQGFDSPLEVGNENILWRSRQDGMFKRKSSSEVFSLF